MRSTVKTSSAEKGNKFDSYLRLGREIKILQISQWSRWSIVCHARRRTIENLRRKESLATTSTKLLTFCLFSDSRDA